MTKRLKLLMKYGGVSHKQSRLSKDALIRKSDWHLKWQLALFEIAKLSGGYADFLERPEDAETVYSNIFTVINNRYVIGYYPTNQKRDGKRREVKIEVRGRPEYIVTGRKAYFLQ